MATEIKPFKIQVPDSAIEFLKDKLKNATFAKESEFSDDWETGSPLSEVKRLAAYWKDGFDWRAQEAQLNKLPHFTSKVSVDGFDDLQIHFLHQKGNRPDSIPLLFSHGCEF